MRKIVIFLLIAFLLTGCNAAADDSSDMLVIDEQFFVMRMLDIVFSPHEFLGQTIRYEGIFRAIDIPDVGELHQVYRYTEGCCGPDGIVGLQVWLENTDIEPFPNGTWVQVTGVLEEFEHQGRMFLRLDTISLIELSERGEEFVTIR